MKKADYYTYPVIFTYDEGYDIAVTFPDLPGCATSGKDENNALSMAKEALGLHLWGIEEDNEPIPPPSSLKDLAGTLEDNEVLSIIQVFMPPIREKINNRFIKKTLSIPYWLNSLAINEGVNFSAVLQKALKEQLHITE